MSGPYDQTQVLGRVGGTGQATASARGERTLRNRNDGSSSTSSSDRGYKATSYSVGGSYQQTAAEGQYVQGVAAGAAYAAPTSYATGGGYVVGGESYGCVPVSSRRAPRYQKQVFRLPDPHAQVRQVRRRLATPEPDTLERVYIQRAANEVIEEIIEVPTTPPPRVQERTVVEPAGPPQVVKRVIRVPPRTGGYHHQTVSYVSHGGQSSGHLLSAGSYGNVQQATGGYQQVSSYAPASGGYEVVSGGYGAGAGGYGAAGGSYVSQTYGSYQSAAPPAAHCFYA